MPLPKPARAAGLQLLGFVVIAAAIFVVGRVYRLDRQVPAINDFIARHQPWSTLCYPLVHATCNLLLLPAGALVIGSGFFFGTWKGFALALTGHLLGASGAFWISRTFGRRFIEEHLATQPQWQEMDVAIQREGWKIVLLSQLSPLFPTSLFNYCYGLTRLRFWPCLGWIALGWAPGMLAYTYLGRLGHLSWQAWQAGNRPTTGQLLLIGGGILMTLIVTGTLATVAFRLLNRARRRAITANQKGSAAPPVSVAGSR